MTQLNEELGAFMPLIPCIATGICAVTAGDSFRRGNTKLAIGLILWFLAAAVTSYDNPFLTSEPGSPWELPGDIPGFLVFACLPLLPVFVFYWIYKSSETFETYVLNEIPPSLYVGLQVYRLGGACYFYLFLNGTMTNIVGFQTGLLDITIGATALPVAYMVATNGIEHGRTKTILTAWNCLGIYDLLSAFALIMFNFIGIWTPENSLSYFFFYPISLICMFQVPLALAIHVLFLSQSHRFGESKNRKSS